MNLMYVPKEQEAPIPTVSSWNSGMLKVSSVSSSLFLPPGIKDLDFILSVMWPSQQILSPRAGRDSSAVFLFTQHFLNTERPIAPA